MGRGHTKWFLLGVLGVLCLALFRTYSFGEMKSVGAVGEFKSTDTLEDLKAKIRDNGYGFTVGRNWVFDMTPEQKERFFSRRPPKVPRAGPEKGMGPLAKHLGKTALPSSFDWRSYNGRSYIGPVRNQGNCGSCYSFAAAAAAEGTYNVAVGNYDGDAEDFSEAFIAWCLGKYGPYSEHFGGCDGADYDYYELEALTQEGIIRESDFPYTVSDPGSCKHWSDPTLVFQNWYRIPCGDIDAMKTALMTYGPLDAAVYVGSAFEAYESGIYEDTRTSCGANPCYYTATNHAVSLVGWDDNGGDGYWILRNSWGTSWGEQGYMRIKYTSAVVSCEAAYLVFNCNDTKLVVQGLAPSANFSVPPDSPVLVKAQVSNECGGVIAGAQVTASFSNGDAGIPLFDDGNHGDANANDGIYANNWTPVTVQGSTVITLNASKNGYTAASTTISGAVGQTWTEGFEGSLFPPTDWTLGQTNPRQTWNSSPDNPHGGAHCAAVYYDEELEAQDELLMTPTLTFTNTGTLSFWSSGSIHWGVEPFDNYDVEVWLIFDDWDGGSGDDVLLGKADDSWAGDWAYARSTFDLRPHLQSKPARIGFRYVGTDGAAVYLDDVRVSTGSGQGTGSLRVTLTPDAAVTAGARWKVDDGSWKQNGDTVAGLAAGTHNVTFRKIAGWMGPETQTVTVKAGETGDLSAAYRKKPTVKVTASDHQASEAGRNKGTFTFTRTGHKSEALTVSYSVKGTAVSGKDYSALSGKVVIPRGKASAKVVVSPVNDKRYEGRETVIVTVKSDSSYLVGSPSRAKVFIYDDDGN
ncbi:MAG TPA: C1 family peptidase [Syntrophobacteraceae bacterium]|nr:C1 family peptidase [Syntrophobacteraceae bacterium]